MRETLLLLAAAAVLGAQHSFAPDHLSAVAVFVARRPSWRGSMALGARWGVGHSVSILLLGGALVLLGARLPAGFAPLAERAVGVVLIAVGVVAMVRALRVHAHRHEHGGRGHWHLHAHRSGEQHDHGHRALLGIGMLHGLAGTGALVVVLPLTGTVSPARAIAFLLAFGAGTVVAMALAGAAAGYLVRTVSRDSALVLRGISSAAGALSVLVGVWWLVAA